MGISTTAPQAKGAQHVDIKAALAEAKRGLTQGLKDWTPPPRQMLPVDPALAASCLKCALWWGDHELAQAAGATLNLFAGHLLWNELLAFAATGTILFDLTPTLTVMTAKRDRAWLRRKGGTGRVTAYLIEMLVQAPRSMDAIHLWRLSFDEPDTVPTPFRETALQARRIRRSMLTLIGVEASGREHAGAMLKGFCNSPEDILLKDICVAAFRQVITSPALMQPVLRSHANMANWMRDDASNGSLVAKFSMRRDRLAEINMALTANTPAGRKTIQNVIAGISECGAELERLGLYEHDSIEVIGELLTRESEDAWSSEVTEISDLQRVSRWSGIGVLCSSDAKSLDDLIRANGAAIAAIRLAHLPTSLTNL